MPQIKTNLASYNNDWYSTGAGRLKMILWYYVNNIFFTSRWMPAGQIKIRLLRLFGAKIGQRVVIKPGVNIKYPWKLKIGHNSWIGENVWIDNLEEVKIGDNCCLSQGAMLLCGNHDYKKSTFDLIVRPIVLEDGVWIGAQSVVCPGTVCRSHSVLTVSSVAGGELESYTIYKGNPAVSVKKRVL